MYITINPHEFKTKKVRSKGQFPNQLKLYTLHGACCIVRFLILGDNSSVAVSDKALKGTRSVQLQKNESHPGELVSLDPHLLHQVFYCKGKIPLGNPGSQFNTFYAGKSWKGQTKVMARISKSKHRPEAEFIAGQKGSYWYIRVRYSFKKLSHRTS